MYAHLNITRWKIFCKSIITECNLIEVKIFCCLYCLDNEIILSSYFEYDDSDNCMRFTEDDSDLGMLF